MIASKVPNTSAIVAAFAGNQSEAEAAVARIRQFSPNYQLADGFLTQFKNPEDRERFLDGLRQAGLS